MMIPTARKLERYIIRCIKSLPENSKNLFKEGRVIFNYGEDGLTLMADPELTDEEKEKVRQHVEKYFETHKEDFICTSNLIH